MKSRFAIAVMFASVICAGPAVLGSPVTRIETRTEKLAYGAKLWVRNEHGAIKVTGWDREEVSLTAQIWESPKWKVELVVRRVGTDLDIEARFPRTVASFNFGFKPDRRCEFTLKVPRKLKAHFRTGNGPVTVVSLEGYARCETTNGNISVRNVAGEARAETTNGSIEARHLRARLQGGTTNGDIILEQVDGQVRMATTNGEIQARNLDGWGEGISLKSNNGAIDLDLGRATGDVHVESQNGTITIEVANAQVVSRSSQTVLLKVPGREQKIILKTVNGSIRVHRGAQPL
jgi:DUF4097 and DUF4098 domain-containing protein YvlB